MTGDPMQGRRVDHDGKWPPDIRGFEPGDYMLVAAAEGRQVQVWFRDPAGEVGRVTAGIWSVTENQDGTVTVEPSINDLDGPFHGWLRGGVWTWAE